MLAPWLLKLAGVEGTLTTPVGVECCVRWQGERAIWFLLNHTAEERHVTLPAPMVDIVSGQQVDAAVILRPRQVLMLTT